MAVSLAEKEAAQSTALQCPAVSPAQMDCPRAGWWDWNFNAQDAGGAEPRCGHQCLRKEPGGTSRLHVGPEGSLAFAGFAASWVRVPACNPPSLSLASFRGLAGPSATCSHLSVLGRRGFFPISPRPNPGSAALAARHHPGRRRRYCRSLHARLCFPAAPAASHSAQYARRTTAPDKPSVALCTLPPPEVRVAFPAVACWWGGSGE